MAVDNDKDVQTAVVALWNQTPGLGTADANNKSIPIAAGKLVAGQTDQGAAGTITPYAHVKVTKGREREYMTGGAYHDYRNVTLTVRGKEADVSAAVALILGTFNLALGKGSPLPTLTMPSGALFRRWTPMNDGDTDVEAQRKKGEELWQKNVKGEVWCVRTDI